MELTQLNQFKKIAEYEKINEAANALYVSSSALSQSLKRLEDELGCELFDRSKNSLKLNEKGKLFLEAVNDVFSVLDKAMSDLKDMNAEEHKSLLIYSCIPTALNFVLPEFILYKNDILINGKMADRKFMEKELLNGNADIIITDEPISGKDIENMPFISESLRLLVPEEHPLASKKEVDITDLEKLNIMRISGDSSVLAQKFLFWGGYQADRI